MLLPLCLSFPCTSSHSPSLYISCICHRASLPFHFPPYSIALFLYTLCIHPLSFTLYLRAVFKSFCLTWNKTTWDLHPSKCCKILLNIIFSFLLYWNLSCFCCMTFSPFYAAVFYIQINKVILEKSWKALLLLDPETQMLKWLMFWNTTCKKKNLANL